MSLRINIKCALVELYAIELQSSDIQMYVHLLYTGTLLNDLLKHLRVWVR